MFKNSSSHYHDSIYSIFVNTFRILPPSLSSPPQKKNTPPKFDSSPLNNDCWKTIRRPFCVTWYLFRYSTELLLNFRDLGPAFFRYPTNGHDMFLDDSRIVGLWPPKPALLKWDFLLPPPYCGLHATVESPPVRPPFSNFGM